MPLTKTTKPRRFQKFVALDGRGNPLWATMANTAAEAKERHDRFNPDPTGQGMGEQVVTANITLKS